MGVQFPATLEWPPSYPYPDGVILGAGDPLLLDVIPHDARHLHEVTLKRVQQHHVFASRRELTDVDHVIRRRVRKLIPVDGIKQNE